MNPPKLSKPKSGAKTLGHFRVPRAALERATLRQQSNESTKSEDQKQESQVEQQSQKRLKIEGVVFYFRNTALFF
jgi:hypothetical protein